MNAQVGPKSCYDSLRMSQSMYNAVYLVFIMLIQHFRNKS